MLAECMLEDVIDALKGSIVDEHDVLTEGSLNEAINGAIHGTQEPVLVIMPDLPLIQPRHINEIVSANADVVIAPGKGGGTNALFLREPRRFRVDFRQASFLNHLGIALDAGMSVYIYDSFFVSTDMDEPEDLVELLIHGKGAATLYLRDLGMTLEFDQGRAHVKKK